MKRFLPLLAFIFFSFSLKSFGSHDVGSEISYHQLAPNSYQVTLKLYRDCTGVGITPPVNLNVSAPGCNAGRQVSLTLVSSKLIKPFGSAISGICMASANYPNYQVITYSGILNFTAAEAACADWVLSWSECCRPATANLVGQDDLYTETKLKLTPGLVNSSPAFDTLHAPVMFASYGVLYNLSMAAVDPDGDSLIYSLVTPLSAANTSVTYKPYPLAAYPPPPNIIINPNSIPPYHNPFTPQYAQLPGNPPVTFSASNPMPTIYVNWTGPPTIPFPGAPIQPMIWAASFLFELNPVIGELKFTPARYVAGTTSASGENKYVVSILVEEYRKVNGVMTKLGSVRRETLIQVIDSPNNIPMLATLAANNQPITAGYEIQLRPGATLNLQFAAIDTLDIIEASTNATYILPGATFAATTGNQVAGSINWTPTAAHIRWQPYYFQILLRDDANPLRGVRTETIAVRVNATGGVTGVSETQFSASTFHAFPNPFSEELNFNLHLKTKAESIAIYNLLGQKVDEISLKTVGLGEQKVQWQNAGKHAAGTYVARLVSGSKTLKAIKFTRLQ